MRLRKRIERMRLSPKSVDPKELESVLLALGFRVRPGKGDHRIYLHPSVAYPLVIDPRKPLLPAYVREALKAIDEVIQSEAD